MSSRLTKDGIFLGPGRSWRENRWRKMGNDIFGFNRVEDIYGFESRCVRIVGRIGWDWQVPLDAQRQRQRQLQTQIQVGWILHSPLLNIFPRIHDAYQTSHLALWPKWPTCTVVQGRKHEVDSWKKLGGGSRWEPSPGHIHSSTIWVSKFPKCTRAHINVFDGASGTCASLSASQKSMARGSKSYIDPRLLNPRFSEPQRAHWIDWLESWGHITDSHWGRNRWRPHRRQHDWPRKYCPCYLRWFRMLLDLEHSRSNLLWKIRCWKEGEDLDLYMVNIFVLASPRQAKTYLEPFRSVAPRAIAMTERAKTTALIKNRITRLLQPK